MCWTPSKPLMGPLPRGLCTSINSLERPQAAKFGRARCRPIRPPLYTLSTTIAALGDRFSRVDWGPSGKPDAKTIGSERSAAKERIIDYGQSHRTRARHHQLVRGGHGGLQAQGARAQIGSV